MSERNMHGVMMSGFADEAGVDIDTQVNAIKELGWQWIELRNVNGTSISSIDDAAFEKVVDALTRAHVAVSCIGSTIANWGCDVRDPFEETIALIERTIPRMKRLNVDKVRIMSYKIIPERPASDQLVDERIKRLREIVARFEDHGIRALHENCANYGGLGWPYTLELIEAVPGLGVLFDTANPATSADHSKSAPYPRQSSWEFYEKLRDRIEYVHVKDGVFLEAVPGATFDKARYTWPGEGSGDVRKIVVDLLRHDYQGFFSIEPHLSVVFHDDGPSDEAAVRFRNFIEYGRRFERLLDACAGEARAGSSRPPRVT